MWFSNEEIHKAINDRNKIRNVLSGDDYDSGITEGAKATAENTAESVIKLIQLLVSKKLITIEEACVVLQQREK